MLRTLNNSPRRTVGDTKDEFHWAFDHHKQTHTHTQITIRDIIADKTDTRDPKRGGHTY